MRNGDDKSTCCFCIHVKVGTFVLALCFMISGLMSIVGSSLVLFDVIKIPQTLSTETDDGDIYQYLSTYDRSTFWNGLGCGVFVTIISALAIYGIMKKRSGFLLPLFIIQFFNFICIALSIGRVMFYWPSVKLELLELPQLPQEYKAWMLQTDDRWLAASLFCMLMVILLVKYYMMSIVYRCYENIAQQQGIGSSYYPEIYFASDLEDGPDDLKAPPKYEDLQKVPLMSDVELIDNKPPPYYA